MKFEVTEADTAIALGSGDVPVLATPRLIAWFEKACLATAKDFLDPGATTVGAGVHIEHLRPTLVGSTLEVRAAPPESVQGRRLRFTVEAVDVNGHVVGSGEIDRVIVHRERFLAAAADDL